MTGNEFYKKMTTGYQIYAKSKNEKFYHHAGFENWFCNEEEAVERCAKLNERFKDVTGDECIIVKIE